MTRTLGPRTLGIATIGQAPRDDIDRRADPAPAAQGLRCNQAADHGALDGHHIDEGLAEIAGEEEVGNVAGRARARSPAADLIDKQRLADIGL